MTNDKLMKPEQQLARKLNQSLKSGSSLDALVAAKRKEEETFLLLDYSSSMNERIDHTGRRKIDALRDIARELRDEFTCPQVGFGGMPLTPGSQDIRFISEVPEPEGMTPLAQGIRFCHDHGAK